MMRRRKRPAAPAVTYPPGYFTAPVRAWAQLQWAGALTLEVTSGGAVRPTDAPVRGRPPLERPATGWGDGTIDLPRTPKRVKPGWMARAPSRGLR